MTSPEAPDPRRWRALAVCLVAGFMTLLDVSIVNVALPPMQRGLGASSAELSWVVSGYALTFGLVLVASGRLGDDRGRKRMFVLSLALFTLTSALAGLAWDGTFLVIMRLLQGVAGGMLNPQVIGFIQQLFRGAERGRAFGFFGAAIGVSTAVGPLAGGLLLEIGAETEAWRYVFYVNVPIGIIALVMATRLLPRDTVTIRGGQPLDLVGALLLGGSVVCLMLPLVLAEQDIAGAPWWLIAVAALILLLFVAWERRAKRVHGHPLIDFALLRTRSYSLGTSLGLLYFAGFTSIFFVLTLFYQQGSGYTPLQAGLALTPFAVGSAVSSGLSGRLVARSGKALVTGGLVLVALGLVAVDVVLRFDPGEVGLATALPLLVAGVGSGLVVAPNQTLALQEVPPAEGGVAAGVLQTGQRIGSAIGISAVGAVFFGRLASTRGDYSSSISAGLIITVGLVVLALVLGLVDLVASRIARRRETTASPAAGPGAPPPDGAATPDGAPDLAMAGSVLASDDGDAPTDEHLALVGAGGGGAGPVAHAAAGMEPAAVAVAAANAGRIEPAEAVDGVPAQVGHGDEGGLRGRIVRHEDGAPLHGAVLTLTDRAGRQVGRAGSAESGRYRLDLPGAGTYQLLVAASGRRPEVGWVRVGEHGDVLRDLALRSDGTVHGDHSRPPAVPLAD